jgi:uncharacterized repeat protein (TIGR03803 family)
MQFKSSVASVAIESSAILLSCLFSISASAATITTEAAFSGSNGAVPTNGNLFYSAQTFYGATFGGGDDDKGVIFQISAASSTDAVTIHSFTGTDGSHPNGSLVADAQGNLYGTTSRGGATDQGTVFKLSKPQAAGSPWSLAVLHSFDGTDGAHPSAGVTRGPDGLFYGVTYDGGTVPCGAFVFHPEGCGTVFKVSATGAFTLVHTFAGFPFEGAGPQTNLAIDPKGVVIGTTNKPTNPGDGGSMFAISPSGALTNVTEFFPKALQGYPVGNIVRDADGNVYGMTQLAGGISSPVQGTGIWEVTAMTHKQVLLKILEGQVSKSGVTRDNAGNLYGTTTGSSMTQGVFQAGAVFALKPGTNLVNSTPLQIQNLAPVGGVILDPAGALWGTSSAGGQICQSDASPGAAGCGTIFKIVQ